MTSTVELYDKAIISRQPNFDERKTRSEFRRVIPNLKTVVVHCFDPRVTGGIPPAVAKALPGQVYPGEATSSCGVCRECLPRPRQTWTPSSFESGVKPRFKAYPLDNRVADPNLNVCAHDFGLFLTRA
jgi:hypothetical protein